MSDELKACFEINDYLDCFGQFNLADTICTRHCALRLRCAIEQDQNTRLEILEDMVAAENMIIKIQ